MSTSHFVSQRGVRVYTDQFVSQCNEVDFKAALSDPSFKNPHRYFWCPCGRTVRYAARQYHYRSNCHIINMKSI